MEGGESPLEVLSRAATMIQETQALNDESKQKQTTKWKRERRLRLPEYTRKSDPKIPETFGGDQPSSPEASASQNGSGSPEDFSNGKDAADTPLDMSLRQRGLPPSYSQTVNNPGYKSNYRQPVVSRDEIPSGISMCDPIIDEHFRRSLGSDYHALFNNNLSKEPTPAAKSPSPPPPPPRIAAPPANVIELMDSAGLSVDDHFAKALGDTWAKLNKKEPAANEGSLLSI
ncbi:unnamed protein product [Brassicogethes aeneus]|uniref:Transcription cofactor vestigial-like protein 4 n=1 Tax=Brassicogethes aeneus TaxID=1431903 RepID=A0A9P0B3P0_BRAAE|nr:unnamed protein product [Brassicogethes aeneus]